MPSAEEIASQKERLYESSSLRDDLNDSEGEVLLKWGEGQIERLATDFPEEFEQKARFMRQLLKGLNRFVGQREFNEMEGQTKYLKKAVMYLEPLGWTGIGQDDLFAVLPEDKADMAANLASLLALLSPEEFPVDTPEDVPSSESINPKIDAIITEFEDNIDENETQLLENTNPHSINQADDNNFMGAGIDYGEEETE